MLSNREFADARAKAGNIAKVRPVAFADADFGNCALLNPGLLRSFERAAPRHMERQSCALESSDSWPRWRLE